MLSLSLRALSLVILSVAKNLAQSELPEAISKIAAGFMPLAMAIGESRDCHGCSLVSLGTPRNDKGENQDCGACSEHKRGIALLAVMISNLEIIRRVEVQNEGKLQGNT